MAKMSLLDQVNRFKLSLAGKLKEAGFILENEMHRLVAIDTGALNRSIKTDNVIERKNSLSVDVGSEGVPYAVYVDQGVRGAAFNYHRNKNVVYTGVGQKWIERSLINVSDQIRDKLLEAKIV